MRRREAQEAVRMAKFLTLLHRWESAELNQAEAAELLGVSERTFRRWTRAYEEDGEAGLIDRRLGKASGRRVPADRAEEVERLYRERYQGFTVKHFHEHLIKDHGFGWSYTWTKLHLQWAGVVPKAPRKGAHRRKRTLLPATLFAMNNSDFSVRWGPVATNSLSAIIGSEQRSVFQDLLEPAGSLRADTGARAGGKKWRKIEGYGRYWSMGALPPLPPHAVHRPSERPLSGVARLAANLAG